MYTAVRTSGLVHKGGTLKVIQSGGRIDATFDPGTCYETICEQTLLNVYDGLVAFKRVGGFAEAQDRARPRRLTCPAPTDGGRTYTFQLRPGIPYSNGTPVRPDGPPSSDRTRALASAGRASTSRTSSEQPPAPRTDATSRPGSSPTRGEHGHLPPDRARPRLPVQARAPERRRGTGEHTGGCAPTVARNRAYEIATFRDDGSFRLVRNPYFHQWSAAAQPNGHPDAILTEDSSNPLAAVEDGKADLDRQRRRLTRRPELRARYGGQSRHDGARQPADLPQHASSSLRQPESTAGVQLRHRPKPHDRDL